MLPLTSASPVSRPAPRGPGAAPAGDPDRYQCGPTLTDPARELRALAMSRVPGPALDSVEFKMLLNPAHFTDVQAGLDGFWSQLQAAAQTSQTTVERSPDQSVKTQDVTYLDTPDFALREQGYNLRRRTKDKVAGNLTLKFRSTDRTQAGKASVEADPDLEQKGKFEKDNTYGNESRSVYSKSNKVKMKKLPKGTLDSYGDTFPVLKTLGIPTDTPLQTVQDRSITEDEHALGQLHLDGQTQAPLELALWYEEGGDPHPALVEFSFSLEDTSDAAERFMQALQRQGGDWVGQGGTKTDFIYSPKS